MSVSYCSRTCQRQDWPQHKLNCHKLAVNEMKRLVWDSASNGPDKPSFAQALKRVRMTLAVRRLVSQKPIVSIELLPMTIDQVNTLHYTALCDVLGLYHPIAKEYQGLLADMVISCAQDLDWSAKDFTNLLGMVRLFQDEFGDTEDLLRIAETIFSMARNEADKLIATSMMIGCHHKAENVDGVMTTCDNFLHIMLAMPEANIAVLDLVDIAMEILVEHGLYQLQLAYLEYAKYLSHKFNYTYAAIQYIPLYIADSLMWLRRFADALHILNMTLNEVRGNREMEGLIATKCAIVAWEREQLQEVESQVRKALKALPKSPEYSYPYRIAEVLLDLVTNKHKENVRVCLKHFDNVIDKTMPASMGFEFCLHQHKSFAVSLVLQSVMASVEHGALEEPWCESTIQALHNYQMGSCWSWRSHKAQLDATKTLLDLTVRRGNINTTGTTVDVKNYEESVSKLISALRTASTAGPRRRRRRKPRSRSSSSSSPTPSSSSGLPQEDFGEAEERDDIDEAGEVFEDSDHDDGGGDEDDNLCSVCLVELNDCVISLSGCKHAFHKACLQGWVAMCAVKSLPSTCPLCRHDCVIFF
jgi:hypothetical protein